MDGDELEFGVSGLLYESNLLMYDRQTESLWSQSRGEAVVGECTGDELEIVPMQLLTFEELSEKYPDALVLSNDTGYSRDYDTTRTRATRVRTLSTSMSPQGCPLPHEGAHVRLRGRGDLVCVSLFRCA